MTPESAPREAAPRPDRRPARPKDAATLVIYRRRRNRLEVLMGQRHANHAFLPNRFVFPGGAVDRGDARVRLASPLAGDVAGRLARSCSPARARALAAAAVRETFEETGLVVGGPDPDPGRPVPGGWRHFFAAGAAPALGDLEYVARAVTPTFRPIRFNARFFMIDSRHVTGDLKGSGELLDIGWIPVDEAAGLEMALITGAVLRLVVDHLAEPLPPPGRPVPVYGIRRGKRIIGRE